MAALRWGSSKLRVPLLRIKKVVVLCCKVENKKSDELYVKSENIVVIYRGWGSGKMLRKEGSCVTSVWKVRRLVSGKVT